MEENLTINPVNKQFSGYYIARQRANLIKDGIENNTAPFIPVNGQVRPVFIYHASTGMPLDAKEMVPAILMRAKNGYESDVVGSYGTVNKANTAVKQNEKGVGHMWQDKDGINHIASLYFPEQTEQPEKLKEYAKLKWQQRLQNETFKIESPSPADYLGTYLAACKSGAKVEVSPEIAEQFKSNMLAVCDNELKRAAEKNRDVPALSDILFSAQLKSTKAIMDRQKELGIGQEKVQERKPNEHKRSQGHGMSM